MNSSTSLRLKRTLLRTTKRSISLSPGPLKKSEVVALKRDKKRLSVSAQRVFAQLKKADKGCA